ncbi:MAG: hypothetical protein GY835_13565 [bacterium]|nr:hypothetical protein [bacterium]
MATGFPKQPTEFCITDVGSTTTKAILFRKEGERWRFYREEAPTTVEKPHEDVTIGVMRAVGALERSCGASLLDGDRLRVPYLSTSSAGGGLAMIVTGLVREVTSRSAERVALGAGSVLLDVIAMDDGRTPYEKILSLKDHRPDMVLLAGGFDGDAISGPVFLGELVRESGLKPKLNPSARLSVLYAGNKHATEFVRDTLGDEFLFHQIENIRPSSVNENLEPARKAIQDLFMEHVMSQAPGYDGLIDRVADPIMPTPAAFGKILALASRELRKRIMAIDIGGATTDVFTAVDGEVSRTVSANLGMSYSLLNVVRTGGIEAVREALDMDLGEADLWDGLAAKHIRPTSLPTSERELRIEWAAATVAIREAVREHLHILSGQSISRQVEDLTILRFLGARAIRQQESADLSLSDYDLVIGSGGILSHSPRNVTGRILTRALQPEKSTELAVDNAFMFPHLGVLSESCPDLALHLFQELGLVELGAPDEGDDGATDDLRLPERVVKEIPRVRIETGDLTMTRELAIPGDLFVEEGATVKPDSVIARSERQFLRPFYLELARVLQSDPHEVGRYLLKEIGDKVTAGELIARRERPKPFGPKEFTSPVSGWIEHLLPSGTLVLREDSEEAKRFSTVKVAKDLRIDPSRIKPYLRVAVGDSVESGQWVAAMIRTDDRRLSRSPVRGKVTDINLRYGIVSIEPLLEELEVKAWLPGVVRDVTPHGCRVVNSGTRIEGIWGAGGEAFGELTFGADAAGKIVVRDTVDASDLTAMVAADVAGLITGSLHIKDVQDLAPGFTIVMTEGFGDQPLATEIRAVLEKHEGRLALIDGTTELRVGVKRPQVLLPVSV